MKTHTLWCAAGVIPLLYLRTRGSVNVEAQGQESLGVLSSVVEQLRSRFGLAGTVTLKIQRLQRECRDILSQQASDQDRSHAQANNTQQGEDTRQLDEYFPQLRAWSAGKDSVCPYLNLGRRRANTRSTWSAGSRTLGAEEFRRAAICVRYTRRVLICGYLLDDDDYGTKSGLISSLAAG